MKKFKTVSKKTPLNLSTMKNLLLCLTAACLFFGCKSGSENKTGQNSTDNLSVTQSIFDKITDLPKAVDLNTNIDNLSLQDLRLLRNYVYAIHGLYFMEADLNAFFKANAKWYEEMVNDLWEEDSMPLSQNDITLSKEEQAFVNKIDKRIESLLASNYTKSNEYTLGNINNIANLFLYKDIDNEFIDKIAQQNFAITPGANLQLFHVYEENNYRQIPNFITTDLFLQAFHMYFSYVLKVLEQEQFIPILSDLCYSLYNESMQLTNSTDADIKEQAAYHATFYAIPFYLLTGEKLTIPKEYEADFQREISNINAQSDDFSPYLGVMDVYFPYSLFKPRGHYTRKTQMQAYFKAMMWLQTATFCKSSPDKLKQTIYSAFLLNTCKSKNGKPLMSLYNSVYEPIVFLIGLPDNLSIMDIALFLEKQGINQLKTALSPESVKKVDNMLVQLAKKRNRIKPLIEVGCIDKINFMPQRYLVDNEILLNMVDPNANSIRAYPKGLDIFAAFGSESASSLLTDFYNEKENWPKFPEKMSQMKTKFSKYDEWNSSIYNKWIESLLEMQKTDKNYPCFMQTKAWDYKNLNTSLASWAELKHDAILYGEQPMTAECGGGGPPKPIVVGYVEPNLRFWNKLEELTILTKSLLEKHGLLSEDLAGKTEQLVNYAQFLSQVSKKELNREKLTESEYQTIEYMGSSVEYFTLSVIDPDIYFDNWSRVEGPDKSIAVVADIYTRNVAGCDKCGVLHVATGNANNIYVVVEIEGYLYLTKGATFSYYEFVQPLNTRLTDEEWQKMLEDKKAPPVQKWMQPLIIDKDPKIDERIFYSSGC